jgi:hypothetical protein
LARERDIDEAVSHEVFRPSPLQPGLFDHRAERARALVLHDLDHIRDRVLGRLAAAERAVASHESRIQSLLILSPSCVTG